MSHPQLYSYSELIGTSQRSARAAVIAHSAESLRLSISSLKGSRTSQKVNQRISQAKQYRAVVNQSLSLRRLQFASISSLENLITENLCMFDLDGRYFLFSERKFFGGNS